VTGSIGGKAQLRDAAELRDDRRSKSDMVLQINLTRDVILGLIDGRGFSLRLEVGDAATELLAEQRMRPRRSGQG